MRGLKRSGRRGEGAEAERAEGRGGEGAAYGVRFSSTAPSVQDHDDAKHGAERRGALTGQREGERDWRSRVKNRRSHA